MHVANDSSPEERPADEKLAAVQREFLSLTPELRGYLFALLADRSLVDDVLQSVFVTLMEQYEKFDPTKPFLPWVRGIARNKALMALREEGRAPRALSPEVIDALDRESPKLDIELERLQWIAECVERLAPKAREAVQLRYRESLKPAEIARRMSLVVDSVHVMLSRARGSVRECVERKRQAEESR